MSSESGASGGDGANGSNAQPNWGTTDALAITPARRQPRQSRPPASMPDLLRLSVEAAAEAGHPVHTTPLSQAARRYLEEALNCMTLSTIQELSTDMDILLKVGEADGEANIAHSEAALDDILMYIDNMDVANDFHKIGGYVVLKPCLDSPHEGIRWRSCEVVGVLAQNNPYGQKFLVEYGLMPCIMALADTDECSTVRVKALFAISCLVREHDAGFEEFKRLDGFSVLLRGLQAPIPKLNIKAAFLLSALCTQEPGIKDDLVDMGYVELLCGQLACLVSENVKEALEHVLAALLKLVEDHEAALTACRSSEMRLKTTLNSIISTYTTDDDEFKDEVDYARSILNLLSGVTEGGEAAEASGGSPQVDEDR